MGTSGTIGYETPDGGYVGVHLHYDSYPEHIAPQLKKMTWDEVSFQVTRAILQSGGRYLARCEIDTFNDGSPVHPEARWPFCAEDFAYRKRLDGSVECVCKRHYFGQLEYVDLDNLSQF